MRPAKPWLPDDCLRSQRSAHSMVEAVGDWSRAWFKADGWKPGTCFSTGVAEGWAGLSDDGRASITARAGAVTDLALAILSTKPPRIPPAQRDLQFLRRLGAKAVDDLSVRIADVLPPRTQDADRLASGPQWQLAIGPAEGPALAVTIGEPDLIALARKTYRPLAARGSMVGPREPLQEMPVTIAGIVGNARLAVEQIKSLEIGDVIVLDQKSDMPVRLVIEGRVTGLPVFIGQQDGRQTLSLQDMQ